MANRHATRPEDGETRLGTDRDGIRGALYVQSNGGADKPSVILLDSCDSSGTVKTWAFWIDNTGDARIVEVGAGTIAAVITNEDSDGTIVGTQS
jgi:hypothetical protein